MRSSNSTFEFLTAAVLCGLLIASCSGNSDGAADMKGSEQGAAGDAGAADAGFATVEINGQVWMAENLNVVKFRNGDPVPEVKSDEEWAKAGEEGKPAWCYYENAGIKGKKYGRLYNWHAVNDSRGLAPIGWHIPSEEEWIKLRDYYGSDAGIYLKHVEFGGGTNESGFSALPGGARWGSELINRYSYDEENRINRNQVMNVGFSHVDRQGWWWSSTDKTERIIEKDNFKCSGAQIMVDEHNQKYIRSGEEIECVNGRGYWVRFGGDVADGEDVGTCPICKGSGYRDDLFDLRRRQGVYSIIGIGGKSIMGGDWHGLEINAGNCYMGLSVRCVKD